MAAGSKEAVYAAIAGNAAIAVTKFVAAAFTGSAAMLGLMVAFVGIFLAHRLGAPWLDGAASVVIGLILAAVAVLLAYESKGLLVGEGADPRTLASIRALAAKDPAIARVVRALTMHFGPQDVLLTLEVQFNPSCSAGEAAAAIDRLDRTIRSAHPEIRHVFIEAQSVSQPAGAVEEKRTAGDRLSGP